MTSRLLGDYISVGVFALVGVVFVIATLAVSRILQPRAPKPEKLAPYECGEVPIGEPWVHFRIRYYVFALLFVIFDIETAFLYPWAVVYGKLGLFALVEMAIFIAVLLVGLVYAWRKGALTWV
jgi:NADH-quinone oxidoreductase subunit A